MSSAEFAIRSGPKRLIAGKFRKSFPELSFESTYLAAETAKISVDLSIEELSKCPNSND
jgi:hypothetical protein